MPRKRAGMKPRAHPIAKWWTFDANDGCQNIETSESVIQRDFIPHEGLPNIALPVHKRHRDGDHYSTLTVGDGRDNSRPVVKKQEGEE